MTTGGFYNADGFFGFNAVHGPDFELHKELKDTYKYPVHGWTWYDSVEEAQSAEGFDISLVAEINEMIYGVQEDA